MKLTTSKLAMNPSAMLYLKKLKYCLVLFLMTLPFLLNAQENEAELPETFYGTWVEDISECNGGEGYRIDITDSEG
jgi:hypothetical protein